MQNFDDAFFSGIEAARQVKRSQSEIDGVLREFAASLEVASGGRVTVAVKDRNNLLADYLSPRPTEAKRTKLIVVVPITAPDQSVSSEQHEVAQIRPAPEGYPCWLLYGGQEYVCKDKQELEEELFKLASSPRMGQAVIRAIDVQNSL